MLVKISEIPPEGFLDVEFSQRLEGLEAEADFKATLSRIGPDVLVRGEVRAKVALDCSRCLESYDTDVTVSFDLSFGSEQDLKEGEYELNMEDVSRALVGDDVIDLGQVASEQVLLNVPMKPLCSDDCKGLCPTCGADLNAGDCGCEQPASDPRFDVLKKFLLEKGEKKDG